MKTRTLTALLIAAVLAGAALAQTPAIRSFLAPLSGKDREIIVETFQHFAAWNRQLAFQAADYSPSAEQTFLTRADVYEQASQFVRDYMPPTAQRLQR